MPPMNIASSVEATMSSSVGPMCMPIFVSTGSWSRYETPQSPVTRLPAQSRYWIGTGRFSPYCAISRSTSSWPRSPVATNCASGPPGARCRIAKAIIETSASSSSDCSKRRRR